MNPDLPSCFDPECRDDKLKTLQPEVLEDLIKKVETLY